MVEPSGLAELCREEWPRLVGLLSLYTGDRDLAEDLAQETLVRLCRHWNKVAGYQAPSAWTYRVAINLAHSHVRRLMIERRLRAKARQPEPHDPDFAESLALRTAVSELPDRQRRVLLLRYFADLPVKDVARILGCPEGSVKTLSSKAIAALRLKGFLDSTVQTSILGKDTADAE